MNNGTIWETGESKEVFSNPQTKELQNFLSSVL
jgi:polar amino acid transport system ATP-binding protein